MPKPWENACTGSTSLAPLAIREDQSDNQASKCCSSGTLLPRREINKFNQSRLKLANADVLGLPKECGIGIGGRRECPELVSDSAAPVDLGLGAGSVSPECKPKPSYFTEGSDLKV